MMLKFLHKHNIIAIAVPLALSPLAFYLFSLHRSSLFLGLSSSYWAGFQIGMSIVAVGAGLITLLLKRKPK